MPLPGPLYPRTEQLPPQLMAHLREGIEDARAGRIVDRGSFAHYVSDAESPEFRRGYAIGHVQGLHDGIRAERERIRPELANIQARVIAAIKVVDTDSIQPGDSGSEAWGK